MTREWLGDNPFYLLLVPDGDIDFAGVVMIDLDTPGWMEANKDRLTLPGTLSLIPKDTHWGVVVVRSRSGVRYASRVFGRSDREGRVRAHGFIWGDPERGIWVLPSGQVCAGEDLDVYCKMLILAG